MSDLVSMCEQLLARVRELESSPPSKLEFMPIAAYAEYRGVCPATVRKWIKLGLPHQRIGRVIRVRVAEADAWRYTPVVK